jgi:hypothetical protein
MLPVYGAGTERKGSQVGLLVMLPVDRACVEVKGCQAGLPVMLPVYRAGVERKGSQVGLAGQGAGEVAWNVALLGEENSVPTQLRHNIFPA